MKLRDRIKEFRRVKASELLPNPKNWRTHPEEQQNALKSVLAEVGIADVLLVRETPHGLMLIDGHLRAETDGDVEWPVAVLDVNEKEADLLLASVDPIAEMAEPDPEKLAALLAEIDAKSAELKELLEEKAGVYSVGEVEEPTLPDGDRAPLRQITFTVHDGQYEEIEVALKKAKSEGGGVSAGNENSNGNALYFICERFNRG